MEKIRIKGQGWTKFGSGIRDKHPGSVSRDVPSRCFCQFKDRCNAETPLTSIVNIMQRRLSQLSFTGTADFRLMDLGDRLRNEGLKFYDTLLHQTDQSIVQVNKSTVKINGKIGFLCCQYLDNPPPHSPRT